MRRRTSGTRTVTVPVSVKVSDNNGHAATLAASLSYAPLDPYAVTLTLPDGSEPVPWVFARDLLLEGVYEPVGEGDVHVWPCLSPAGGAVVMIELIVPGGGVLVEAPARTVQEFLVETLTLVPIGQEALQYDVDVALAVLRA